MAAKPSVAGEMEPLLQADAKWGPKDILKLMSQILIFVALVFLAFAVLVVLYIIWPRTPAGTFVSYTVFQPATVYPVTGDFLIATRLKWSFSNNNFDSMHFPDGIQAAAFTPVNATSSVASASVTAFEIPKRSGDTEREMDFFFDMMQPPPCAKGAKFFQVKFVFTATIKYGWKRYIDATRQKEWRDESIQQFQCGVKEEGMPPNDKRFASRT